MCRIAAWKGRARPLEDIVVTQPHSLLEQSQHAEEAKLSVNGDGFGFAWYDAKQPFPGLYRDVLPAWSDGNLLSLCRMIHAPLFIAHVRASTTGETARTNCHPFTSGGWSFCHNGQIPAFPTLRRRMEADLPDALYKERRGNTDSEMLFLTLLKNGLIEDPATALAATIAGIKPEQDAAPNRITIVFSDGQSLFACRHATDEKAPSLYLNHSACGGHTFASEPLDSDPTSWERLPPDQLFQINPDNSVVTTPLHFDRV